MRKRFLRYPLRFPVAYLKLGQEEACPTGAGWTEDLGERGACLKLPCALHLGWRLGLVIFAEPEVVEAEAVVVWVRAGGQRNFYYHGVEFLHLTPAYYESLLEALPQQGSLQRRVTQRFPVRLPVSCRVGRTDASLLEGRTGNISRSGAMILLPQRIPPRTRVELTLYASQPDRIRGRVRWVAYSSDDAGLIRHGIEFLQGPLAPQRFINLFPSSLTEQTPDPESPSGPRISQAIPDPLPRSRKVVRLLKSIGGSGRSLSRTVDDPSS
ncbi:MAG: PilZ domain-containing protein [Candidatus Methylomirabilales bacterium]